MPHNTSSLATACRHVVSVSELCCHVFLRRMAASIWEKFRKKRNMASDTAVSYTDTVLFQNATQDLFELLERVQSSRLDDQRCVLPPYFTQVGKSIELSRCQGSPVTATSEYYVTISCCMTTSPALVFDHWCLRRWHSAGQDISRLCESKTYYVCMSPV
jgi:hypothetical protein